MAADAERGRGKCDLDCVVRGRGARHQRSAGQQAGLMQLRNGTVDTARQSKVVGICNEPAHRVSLSTRCVKLPIRNCAG